MARLNGKVPVVTGGANGLGEAIAACMSEEGEKRIFASQPPRDLFSLSRGECACSPTPLGWSYAAEAHPRS